MLALPLKPSHSLRLSNVFVRDGETYRPVDIEIKLNQLRDWSANMGIFADRLVEVDRLDEVGELIPRPASRAAIALQIAEILYGGGTVAPDSELAVKYRFAVLRHDKNKE